MRGIFLKSDTILKRPVESVKNPWNREARKKLKSVVKRSFGDDSILNKYGRLKFHHAYLMLQSNDDKLLDGVNTNRFQDNEVRLNVITMVIKLFLKLQIVNGIFSNLELREK